MSESLTLGGPPTVTLLIRGCGGIGRMVLVLLLHGTFSVSLPDSVSTSIRSPRSDESLGDDADVGLINIFLLGS